MGSGVIVDDEIETSKALVSKNFQTFSNGKVPTFIDSGASDTMFVSRGDFSTYRLTPPRSGDSAKAIDGNFEIVGEGTVVKRYLVEGKERRLTYTRATLNANLTLYKPKPASDPL